MASKRVSKKITSRRNAMCCSRKDCYSSSSESILPDTSDTDCDCLDCCEGRSQSRKTTKGRPKKKDSKKMNKPKDAKKKETKSKASKHKRNCCQEYSSSSSWSSSSSDSFSDSDSDCQCSSSKSRRRTTS
ncbi:suppressor protein SRP40-like isoform X2 [Polistes fuscatus]|nr:suppressor protein SRP40-like isoform X2 [Polistes fuscatus]